MNMLPQRSIFEETSTEETPTEVIGRNERGDCPIRGTLAHVNEKWSLLLIDALAGGPLRFGQLRREVSDISQRMLTETLRSLQRDGLVARQVFATSPPTVEYRLTELGHSFLEPVAALITWAKRRHLEITAARESFDRTLEGRSQSFADGAKPQP